MAIIDVWDPSTFGRELTAELVFHRDTIKGYLDTDRKQFLERESSNHTAIASNNTFARAFSNLTDSLSGQLGQRIIRAWHYTRLTDDEIGTLSSVGILLSGETLLRQRLDTQIAAGGLDKVSADRIFSDSPIHSDQRQARDGKFWMVSHPIEPTDAGVEPLLGHWGGELVYFWQKDAALKRRLKSMGRSRILEIAIPLEHTRHQYSAAKSILAAFGRHLGCYADDRGFDLYSTSPLPASSLIKVHTQGNGRYAQIGTNYPDSYAAFQRIDV